MKVNPVNLTDAGLHVALTRSDCPSTRFADTPLDAGRR